MPQPDARGRPPGRPENRPNEIAPASADTTPTQGASSALKIARADGEPRAEITCRVSLLIPDEIRTYWHYLAHCPVCGRPHLGRSRELAGVTGTRRLPCRHWVTIVVARTYGRTGSGAAA